MVKKAIITSIEKRLSSIIPISSPTEAIISSTAPLPFMVKAGGWLAYADEKY